MFPSDTVLMEDQKEFELGEFKVPEPFFKVGQSDEAVTCAILTGHKINGLRLMKEITLCSSGSWQLQIGDTVVPNQLFKSVSEVVTNLVVLQGILDTVNNITVCEGVGIDVEKASEFSVPSSRGSVATWECDGGHAAKTVRWRSKGCHGALLGLHSSLRTCKACSDAWHGEQTSQPKQPHHACSEIEHGDRKGATVTEDFKQQECTSTLQSNRVPGESWSLQVKQLVALLGAIPAEKQPETIALLETYIQTWKIGQNEASVCGESAAIIPDVPEDQQESQGDQVGEAPTPKRRGRKRKAATELAKMVVATQPRRRTPRRSRGQLPPDVMRDFDVDEADSDWVPAGKSHKSPKRPGRRKKSQKAPKQKTEPGESGDKAPDLGCLNLAGDGPSPVVFLEEMIEMKSEAAADTSNEAPDPTMMVYKHDKGDELGAESTASASHSGAVERVDDYIQSNETNVSSMEESVNPATLKKKAKDLGFKEALAARTCQVCGRILSSRYSMPSHMHIHSDEFPHKCEQCGKGFNQNETLRLHIKKHHTTDKPEFRCSQCDFAAYVKGTVDAHFRDVHSCSKDFLCDVCGKGFPSKRKLRHHREVHMPKNRLKCPECDYSTHNSSCMSSHRCRIHPNVERPGLICEICGNSFASRCAMETHMNRHYGVITHTCTTCGKGFTGASLYNTHKLIHLPPTFECQVCHKKFHNKDRLQRHSIVHSSDKPFHCPRCNYSCNMKCNLRKHCLNTHQILYPPKGGIRVTRVKDIQTLKAKVKLDH